ncbi:hypothetical protein BV25DRAFT_117355 [Artomyces pyxidatus]|uniref:Uncharacterized protein n=1 Tax=Artomyces pyxidatus TaxID=48021 RepID=A0ACB8TLA3_9AGAM|nr:hypothetical protein BV25DRAFT_117355 [Artomyces pyxidatus]
MQPPRPPSSQHPSLGHPQPSQHQQPHQQSSHPPQPPQPPHLSPQHQNRQVNGHVPHPARPQSQPQPPGRPPSQQTAPSRTPHLPHSSLPANATLLQAANIGGHPPPQRPPSHPGMPPTTPLGPPGPQPPQAQPPIPSQMMRPTGPQPVPSTPTTEGGIMRGLPGPVVPPVRPMQPPPPIGFGQGLVRLLQFSGSLASEHRDRLQLTHWEELVKDYFLPMATLKLTLWKDNQKNEAKVFEVGTPILPRFFLVTSQSGVKSMTLSLDGARERLYAQNQAVVECTSAVWTYRYYNGYTVTLRGPFTAHVLVVPTPPANGAPAQSTSHPNYSIKIYNIHFDSNLYEKHISVDVILGQRIDSPKTPRQRNAQTPTLNGVTPQQKAEEEKWEEPRIVFDRASIPSEPVNAFGIPQATMRCLELAESVGQMTELIQFSMEADCGPLESLKQFAQKIRETPVPGSLNTPGGPPNGIGMPGSYNTDGIMVNGGVPQNSTLYPPTPMSGPPGSAGGPQPGGSLPPATPSTSSPGKSKNGTPQQSHAPNPATSGSSSAHTPNTTSTPSMANATLTNNNLKRKAQPSETASPTTASSDQPPPAKRNQRKRGRTTGGG